MTQTPRILRTSKLKSLVLLLVSAGFVAIGIWQGVEGEKFGWYGAAFFGLCGLVAVINLFPNSSYLVLNRDGFTIRSLYREGSYKWTDVQPFRVGLVGTHRMVVFDFSEEYASGRGVRKVVGAILDAEGALPDNYGLSLEKLAETMNAAREEALKS